MLNKAVIDLRVIKKNALAVKKLLPDKTRLCAVVKANAYGHGAEKVADALYALCDMFAVALTEEGVGLRLSGIDKPVLVLLPCLKKDLGRAIDYGLTVTVQNEEDVIRANNECVKKRACLSVHIKYNTGMNRLGVNGLKELSDLLKTISHCERLKLEGLFSHLACPENEKEVKRACDKFLLARTLVKSYNKNAICHLSASGGLLRGKTFDMVRTGILLYGYKPFDTSIISVKPAMRVFAPVVKNVYLSEGQNALYGECKSDKNQKISLIRYGYADGLNRVAVNGQFNDRCMDLTAVENFNGKYYPVMVDAQSLAEKYNTISYEILTKSANRAERIYLE